MMSAATSQSIAPEESVTRVREAGIVSAPPPRNIAVDAYRGLVMVLMMGEVMR